MLQLFEISIRARFYFHDFLIEDITVEKPSFDGRIYNNNADVVGRLQLFYYVEEIIFKTRKVILVS
jgi:hypothetical protein